MNRMTVIKCLKFEIGPKAAKTIISKTCLEKIEKSLNPIYWRDLQKRKQTIDKSFNFGRGAPIRATCLLHLPGAECEMFLTREI